MISAFPVTQHLMSNIEVQLDGDRANVRTMVTNPQGAATREGPLHFFYVGGRYDDDFVRTADGWKIARRVETTLWFEGSLPTELLRTV
jgi:3-phenylpropionate/cinnamic acid dioxygenase small subunit